MAAEKNITMKQFNGTDYDILYPKTIASQIPDVYSKSETYPQSQLYTRSQLYTQSQINSMINTINTALNGKARIQTGSYVGTGTYGASNPCSLTFDFEPQVVFLSFCKRSKYDDGGPNPHDYFSNASPAVAMIRGCPYFATYYISPTDSYSPQIYGGINKVTFDGNRVSWYIDQEPRDYAIAETQFNGLPEEISGHNTYIRYYNYIGIG